ncbi:hypothetical protein B7494_g4289 [Chlorociboria aeruginascens]|nr:hypothetical protein B7494_g4289 [Chlorociboria aeruginascens]
MATTTSPTQQPNALNTITTASLPSFENNTSVVPSPTLKTRNTKALTIADPRTKPLPSSVKTPLTSSSYGFCSPCLSTGAASPSMDDIIGHFSPCPNSFSPYFPTISIFAHSNPRTILPTNFAFKRTAKSLSRSANLDYEAIGDDTEKAEQYLIITKLDTSLRSFEAFISNLPDRGNGSRILFPHTTSLGYTTFLRPSSLQAIKEHEIVRVVLDESAGLSTMSKDV